MCVGVPTIAPCRVAAYLLTASSVPNEARDKSIERAEAREKITTTVAKEILAETRKKKTRRRKAIPSDKLAGRLVKVLDRYRDRWDQKQLAELARQFREFADTLDAQKGGRKAKKE